MTSPAPETYSLIDCGDGRRLERFGSVVVDRPAPAAVFPAAASFRSQPRAALRFSREDGWTGAAPDDWRVRFGAAVLRLRPAGGGQVGVFPEHAAVAAAVDALLDQTPPPPGGWRVLNLFAHTGLLTLRLAARSGVAAVAHVDAAPAALRQARENAVASDLENAPVRWLEDDALSFLRREIRRGNTYHLILADPPSYGRGKKGGEWKLERDLPALLAAAGTLFAPEARLLCLTCHSEGWGGTALARAVAAVLPDLRRARALPLELSPESGSGRLALGQALLAVGGTWQGNF